MENDIGVRRRLLIIYNPSAGWRRRRRFRRVIAALHELGCQTHILETTGPGDAETFARRAAARDYDAVVAAGGDGTINEVVNGLVAQTQPLAIIPLGTANVLSAEIRLTPSPRAVANAIARGPVRDVHVGVVNDRRFVMMAGVGFDAYVVSSVHPGVKRAIGKLAYVGQMIAALFDYPFRHFRVEIDGRPFEAASAIIANGHYYGGRFVFAHEARLDTPGFQVCLFKSTGPMRTLRYTLWMALGRLHRLPDFEVVKGREVRIHDGEGAPVQGDGDIVAQLPMRAWVNHETLALVMPA